VAAPENRDDVTMPSRRPRSLGCARRRSPAGTAGSSGAASVTTDIGTRSANATWSARCSGAADGRGRPRARREARREIALKLVGETLAKTLREEVRLAQRVTHPNVCGRSISRRSTARTFVKMEFVAGETLSARLARERKAPDRRAVRIARAVAAGLTAAHEQGIVHRDLSRRTSCSRAIAFVLMDFGIARLVNSSMHTLAGTFAYMAPEQFANTRVDRRADLYGLGCLDLRDAGRRARVRRG